MEKILVFTCDNITTPLVHGLLRPRIFMPAEMDFTESKLVRHILLHELVHIKLWHNWLKTAMLVALCLNWYNPLAWVMDDPLRGFGATNPLGTVDVVIERDSTGGIAEITAYHEGDGVYDRHTKAFPEVRLSKKQ